MSTRSTLADALWLAATYAGSLGLAALTPQWQRAAAEFTRTERDK